ncbi:MAG TPA: FAD binding domain-containing protein [Conexibacter sp.]|jgi:carbon-monoxide dehydrogenase medium subunit
MKPAAFEYHAPREFDDVLELLADDSVDARVIAGGQSLVPMMSFRLAAPERLVDLRRVEALRELRVEADGTLVVGASVTQARLLRTVERSHPLLAEGISHIGHPQIRSRGTVCGSLAHHDPTAELPALALALDARFSVVSAEGGERELDADEFFVSYYEVALEPGEMLASVTFPAWSGERGWSFRELARRRGDFALVGAVATVERSASGTPSDPRLVLFGVGERPVRMHEVEAVLDGAPLDAEGIEATRALIADAITPVDDVHASAEYRREAAVELAVDALAEAWGRSRDV